MAAGLGEIEPLRQCSSDGRSRVGPCSIIVAGPIGAAAGVRRELRQLADEAREAPLHRRVDEARRADLGQQPLHRRAHPRRQIGRAAP